MKHRVEIILTDEEEKFLEWMLKDNTYGAGLTKAQLLMLMLSLQLREDMDTMYEESQM